MALWNPSKLPIHALVLSYSACVRSAIFCAGRCWACIVVFAVRGSCFWSSWRKVCCYVGLMPAYLRLSEKLQILLCYFVDVLPKSRNPVLRNQN